MFNVELDFEQTIKGLQKESYNLNRYKILLDELIDFLEKNLKI
jgi:hypothetical protein